MRLVPTPSRRSILAVLPFVAACATAGSPTSSSPAERFLAVRDSLGIGHPVYHGEQPSIRLSVMPRSATQVVDADFHVSDDAYAFVAVVDLDRRIRVLYPESPTDVARVSGGQRHELTRFFAGFGNGSLGFTSYTSRYRLASYDAAFARITPFEGGGVIVAIASDRPLQLDRLSDADGDWDEGALEEYLINTRPSQGVREIGRALTISGQEFTSDIQAIGGQRAGSALGFATRSCLGAAYDFNGFDDFGYGGNGNSWGGGGYLPSRVPVARYTVGTQTFVRYVETDACGRVTYVDIPMIAVPRPADSTRAVTRAAFRLPVDAAGATTGRPWRHTGRTDDDPFVARATIQPREANDVRARATTDRPAVRDEPGSRPRIEPRARTHETVERPATREAPAPASAPAARPAPQARPNQ